MRGRAGRGGATLASIQLRQRPRLVHYCSVDWARQTFGKDGCFLEARQ
ncbi:hypothetical protein MUK42_34596 [Musa troglodytarum]|uniref:Uncharacterized protein n=1 Tax=Musa troglodytarum TaxID=320322 RepID=A0A9E7FF01_9LILI|nr:hypothetical protein MUK42_34596 [Musa troglodytarum]